MYDLIYYEFKKSTYNYISMSRQNVQWLAGVVIPGSQRMIFTTSQDFGTIWVVFDTSDTHGMSDETGGGLHITVSEFIFGNTLVFSTNKDGTFL